MDSTAAARIADYFRPRILTTAELRASGMGPRHTAAAVRQGTLVRLRRGRYATPDIAPDIAEAVHAGARVACITLLKALGVFVLTADEVHVHHPKHASLSPAAKRPGIHRHWMQLRHEPQSIHAVTLIDAIAQATICQEPRAALATLDSVAHLRLVSIDELRALVRTLPHRFHVLALLIDASSGSGSETFMRLILRALGIPFATQVQLPGVGRVDFVVDGWLIIECDSRAFHHSWEQQREDRRRDIAAAAQGYMTLRFVASEIFDDAIYVRDQIIAVLDAAPARR